jgi:hypothetical protein
MSRPCKLQFNDSGSWRNVLRFDADTTDVGAIQEHAANLVLDANPKSRTTLRIAVDDAMSHCLRQWDATRGWRDWNAPSGA